VPSGRSSTRPPTRPGWPGSCDTHTSAAPLRLSTASVRRAECGSSADVGSSCLGSKFKGKGGLAGWSAKVFRAFRGLGSELKGYWYFLGLKEGGGGNAGSCNARSGSMAIGVEGVAATQRIGVADLGGPNQCPSEYGVPLASQQSDHRRIWLLLNNGQRSRLRPTTVMH
jgi:hypothetical protein